MIHHYLHVSVRQSVNANVVILHNWLMSTVISFVLSSISSSIQSNSEKGWVEFINSCMAMKSTCQSQKSLLQATLNFEYKVTTDFFYI